MPKNKDELVRPSKQSLKEIAALERGTKLQREAEAKLNAQSKEAPSQYPGEAEIARRQAIRKQKESGDEFEGYDEWERKQHKVGVAKENRTRANFNSKSTPTPTSVKSDSTKIASIPKMNLNKKATSVNGGKSVSKSVVSEESIRFKPNNSKEDTTGLERTNTSLSKLEPKTEAPKIASSEYKLNNQKQIETMPVDKPKKMNFIKKFVTKQREKEQAFQDYSDAEDVKETQVKTPAQYNITQEKSFVGPTKSDNIGESGYANETSFVGPIDKAAEKKVADNAASATKASTTEYSKPEDRPAKWNDPAEMARVRAYQKRHGLKVDGVWGEKTEAYFQANKNAPKKMAIKKTSTSTSTPNTTTVKTTTPVREAGKYVKSTSANFVNSGDGNKGKDWSKPTTVSSSSKTMSYEEAQRTKNIADRMYGDPETSSGGWVDRKSAEKLADIDAEGDKQMLKTLGAVGVGGATLSAAALLLNRRKKGGAKRTTGALTEAAGDALKSSTKSSAAKKTIEATRVSTHTPSTTDKSSRLRTYEGAVPERFEYRGKKKQAPLPDRRFTAAGNPSGMGEGSQGPKGRYMTDAERSEHYKKYNTPANNTRSADKYEIPLETEKTSSAPTKSMKVGKNREVKTDAPVKEVATKTANNAGKNGGSEKKTTTEKKSTAEKGKGGLPKSRKAPVDKEAAAALEKKKKKKIEDDEPPF